MKRIPLVVLIAIVAVALAFARFAYAEHLTLVDESGALRAPETKSADREPRTFDMDLRLGEKGFRLGGRFFGAAGVAGAWLNGDMRPDGFALDGRVQSEGGRAYNFKLNADIDRMARTAWQWFCGKLCAE
jgi:hypothetical protein